MIELVAGPAEYYHFSLDLVHKEEMDLALFWQKTFFKDEGHKKNNFGLWRKMKWRLADRRHIKTVNKM